MKKARVPKISFRGDESHQGRKFTCRMTLCGWLTETKLTGIPSEGTFHIIDDEVRQLLERTPAQWQHDDPAVYLRPRLSYAHHRVKMITAATCPAWLRQSLTQLIGRECIVSLCAQYREFPGDHNEKIRVVVLMVYDVKLA